jgi:hypothetical protein
LQSGNSVAFDGNVGIGEGNNEAQGSGQLYFLNPNGSTADNTKYEWLGQADTNAALADYQHYQSASNPAGNLAQALGPGFSISPGLAEIMQMGANPEAASGFDALYNSTGGQAKWGESQSDWVNSLVKLMSDANSNGGSGLYVGQG